LEIGAALKEARSPRYRPRQRYFEDLVRKEGLDFVELGTRDEFLRLGQPSGSLHPIRSFF